MDTAESILNDKNQAIIGVPPTTILKEALRIMTDKKVGSMMVMDGSKVLGIWTERDLLRNVLTEGFSIDTALIGDYMTTKLSYAEHTLPSYLLMDKFLGLRIRHLLIEKEGEFIGVLSTGDVIKAALRDTFSQLKQEKKDTSWEYYESWGWEPKD